MQPSPAQLIDQPLGVYDQARRLRFGESAGSDDRLEAGDERSELVHRRSRVASIHLPARRVELGRQGGRLTLQEQAVSGEGRHFIREALERSSR